MEKDVAVREWCIDRVLELKRGLNYSPKDVIRCAKELEDYLWGREPKAETPTPIRYRCPHCRGDLEALYIATGSELIAEFSCPKCDK